MRTIPAVCPTGAELAPMAAAAADRRFNRLRREHHGICLALEAAFPAAGRHCCAACDYDADYDVAFVLARIPELAGLARMARTDVDVLARELLELDRDHCGVARPHQAVEAHHRAPAPV